MKKIKNNLPSKICLILFHPSIPNKQATTLLTNSLSTNMS